MVYPTPGFVVRQTFLEFEDPDLRKKARGWRRVASDSDLCRDAQKLVSLYGSEDLRLYCEGGGGRALRGETGDEEQGNPTVSSSTAEGAVGCTETLVPYDGLGTACVVAEEAHHEEASSSSCLQGFREEECTTLLLQDLPQTYTRCLLLEMLDKEGFAGCYDFVYVPVDLLTMAANGYAFVNFRTHGDARRALQHFDGFDRWLCESDRVCRASWSTFCQGLEAHIERYRNSPVMHEKVPDICKPVIFSCGAPAPFPAPTKRLRMPRVRGKTSARQRPSAPDQAKVCADTEPEDARGRQPLSMVTVCG